MLRAVEAAGGLAIAFNANQYALPQATISLASPLLSDLTEILQAWANGQRKEVEKIIKTKEKSEAADDRSHFHWLSGRENIDEVIEVHQKLRRRVREAAGRLG